MYHIVYSSLSVHWPPCVLLFKILPPPPKAFDTVFKLLDKFPGWNHPGRCIVEPSWAGDRIVDDYRPLDHTVKEKHIAHRAETKRYDTRNRMFIRQLQ